MTSYFWSSAYVCARRQAAWLCNKIIRALQTVGFSRDRSESTIVDSDRLDGNLAYQASLLQGQKQFEQDQYFRRACLEATGWVLQRRRDEATLSDSAVQCAVQYLLAELPLFLAACDILECDSAVFCYHQHPKFVDELFRGQFGQLVSRNQGFVVARPLAAAHCESA